MAQVPQEPISSPSPPRWVARDSFASHVRPLKRERPTCDAPEELPQPSARWAGRLDRTIEGGQAGGFQAGEYGEHQGARGRRGLTWSVMQASTHRGVPLHVGAAHQIRNPLK